MVRFLSKNFWKIGLGLLFLVFFILPLQAHAEAPTIEKLFLGGWWGDSKTGLLACDGKVCTDFCQILELLNNLLFFGLTLLIYVIAPIRFIIGGFLIMTSAGEERLSKGKSMINGTVIGLLIALGAFAIVATFLWAIGNNSADSGEPRVAWPSIACVPGAGPFNLRFATTTITTSTGGPVGEVPGGPYAAGTHEQNLQELASQPYPITVVATQGGVVRADCSQVSGPCTSVEGLPSLAIAGLKLIKEKCGSGCSVVLTGGTETVDANGIKYHKTHGPDRAIVDIDDNPAVDAYIYGVIGTDNPVVKHWYQGGEDGFWYYFESNHWHICFGEPCYINQGGD